MKEPMHELCGIETRNCRICPIQHRGGLPNPKINLANFKLKRAQNKA